VLFLSAAEVYKESLTGILVTGSNEDGALGIKSISDNGGITIVQNPKEASLSRMPAAALKQSQVSYVFNSMQILDYLNQNP
jgi:two-component system chemotaxis response regulator CheB